MKEKVNGHLQRAEEFLKEGKYLLEGDFEVGVIRSAYYAMFHAATAALFSIGIERSSHHALIAAFGQFLAKDGKVPVNLHSHLKSAFLLRSESDYLLSMETNRKVAETQLERARKFVDACREFCESDGA